MQSIDTNVLVRLLVKDDLEQGERAEKVFRQAAEYGGVWLDRTVLVETVWVLRAAYRFERTAIVEILRRLLETSGVSVEAEGVVRSALSLYETGPADFADSVILESARQAGALPLWTFDGRLVRSEGAMGVPEL